jgi:hypothetical protein
MAQPGPYRRVLGLAEAGDEDEAAGPGLREAQA